MKFLTLLVIGALVSPLCFSDTTSTSILLLDKEKLSSILVASGGFCRTRVQKAFYFKSQDLSTTTLEDVSTKLKKRMPKSVPAGKVAFYRFKSDDFLLMHNFFNIQNQEAINQMLKRMIAFELDGVTYIAALQDETAPEDYKIEWKVRL
jgi:hypothetical protein